MGGDYCLSIPLRKFCSCRVFFLFRWTEYSLFLFMDASYSEGGGKGGKRYVLGIFDAIEFIY